MVSSPKRSSSGFNKNNSDIELYQKRIESNARSSSLSHQIMPSSKRRLHKIKHNKDIRIGIIYIIFLCYLSRPV